MPFVKLKNNAGRAIQSFFEERRISRPVRIDLRSTGCCDPSLGLWLDVDRSSDMKEVSEEGLTFVISPDLYQMTGEVTISYDDTRRGFILNPERAISEWDGFGVCTIKIEEESQG